MRVTYFTLQLQFTILHIKLNNTQFCQISESVKFWKIKSLSHFVEIRQKSNVSIDYCFILNKWTAVREKVNYSLWSLFWIHFLKLIWFFETIFVRIYCLIRFCWFLNISCILYLNNNFFIRYIFLQGSCQIRFLKNCIELVSMTEFS